MTRFRAHDGRMARSAGTQWLVWTLALCASGCEYAPTDDQLADRTCVSIGTAGAPSIRFATGRFSAPAAATPDAGISQTGTFRVCQPTQFLYLQTDDGRCGCFEIKAFRSAPTEIEFEPADPASCARAAIACTGARCDHANGDPPLLAAVPAGRWSCTRGAP